MANNTPPVEKINDGPVKASVWDNDGPYGAFRTVTFQTTYRDNQGKPHSGYSYTLQQLDNLQRVLDAVRPLMQVGAKASNGRDPS